MNYIYRTVLFLIISMSPIYAWKAEGACQLLEVYTSEGCSSCPPADRWLSNFKSSKLLWKNIVPISLHVDYWDYIGWRDKFAKKEFGERQREYSKVWKQTTVYTPGVVLQGNESEIGISFKNISGKLNIEWNGKRLLVGSEGIKEKTTLHFAWLGMDLVNSIKKGENAGKTLNHDFVVLAMGSIGDFVNGSEIAFSKPVDLIENPKALVFWLESNRVPIIAVGNYL